MRTPMLIAALAVALGGCLSVPDEAAPECSVTADCDQANGEVCDDGTCWGNPPMGTFAAVLSPPSERKNLATRELPELLIHPDGWIDEIRLDKPLLYSAQLVCEAPLACEDAALGATITVTRPSTFVGGPGFKAVVTADGSDPFQLAVSTPGEYQLTVMPSGRDAASGEVTPAQLMPPLRTTLAITSNLTNQRLVIGRVGLPSVTGVIKDDAGQPQANYRVVALGRWDTTSAPVEVSTVDYTGSDGQFALQLAANLSGTVELVARPTVAPVRPTLYAGGIGAATGAAGVALTWPAGVGARRDIDFDVKGVDGSGASIPVAGARVMVTAKVVSTTLGLAATTLAASYTAEATTGETGHVTLPVLDGEAFAASYRLSIVPPASSTMGVFFDQPLSLLAPIPPRQLLPTRLALRGVVEDVHGNPLKDVAVTARPSLRFVWSLETASQAFLTAIPPPTATTPNTGEYLLWVDPNIGDIWGHYDLVFEPTAASRAPAWTWPEVEIPRSSSTTTVPLPTINLPDAAFVRAHVVDDAGEALEGAELKLYRTDLVQTSLCGDVKNPPASCSVPALLGGRGTSDGDGEVRLTLPRP